MHTGRGAAQQVRVGHVVRGVADVAERKSGELALAFPDGLQIGENLAWVEPVGERIDDGHAAYRRHRLDAFLGERAPHDGGHLAVEYPRGVLDRLAAPELARLRVDDQWVAPQLGDADAERHARSRRVLVEDHRDGTRAGERLADQAVRLHGVGQGEDVEKLSRAEVVVTEEVPRHPRLPVRRAAAASHRPHRPRSR
jgi:hypothetical protein